MTAEGGAPPGPGLPSKVATTLVLVLLGFTLVLIVLSFPAGLYAVFRPGWSQNLTYGSLVTTYLWIGPAPAVIPILVPLGGLFVVLLAIYAGMFAVGLGQTQGPLRAMGDAYRGGIGYLLSSPFIVTLVAIGFLGFSGIVVAAVSAALAGPVGNPFSSVNPLLEFGSLTFAPLREEFGFRVVLIGLVAFVLSVGRPWKDALRSLWRPSAAYEGLAVGSAVSVIIWLAMGASAATFGVCHVSCVGGGGGWNWSKLPEALWGGLVLGYLYVKYGFHVAVLAHWGLDYFASAFSYFGQAAYGIPANSTTGEFFGQYLVDLDMVFLFGAACFVLVVYLVVKRYAGGGNPEAGFVDKGPPQGGGAEI